MKLVFVHDHKFRQVNGKIYSLGGLSNEALLRYVNVFGDTTVIARILKEDNTGDKYSEITDERITVKNGLELGLKGIENEINECDFVISRMPSFLGLKAIEIAKKLNKPLLIEMVACPWDSLWNHSLKGKLVAPYMTYRTKKVAKNASHVVYVTNNFLQKRYPTNGKSVNCSNVVLSECEDAVLERRLKKLENPKDKIIIGTVAALNVKFKGQQYIIEALGHLKKQGINKYEYHLVGSGDDSYLRKMAKKYDVVDEIKFIGSKPHNEVFKWLETIDLYVQPSRQEGLPRALIEAMSRGLPAFGAKTGGIPELIDSKYIFSNSSKNINEICEILKNFETEDLKTVAITNFNNSKKYIKNIIDDRRNLFFENFKDESMNQSKMVKGE
ncbi:glycosyltransferase [Clostridium sp.]|uniref:glycosyltransferase family 4 protein n=1 Tax=Clostridium sp. TaxID=1506 RepID=UPI001B6C015A|nr:glycosyltransferase [Clostridium sp.]MBP3917180.1 glycosyltransferase family 4 protein [Clostridium sp.]